MIGTKAGIGVLAPDARLRAPKRALPRGTVDCHAHIFDRFERYPLAAGRKYSPPLCTREAWLALHAALGVARGVQVHGSPYGFDNSITLDFLQEHRGRFVGVAAISPDVSEAELKRLNEGGFRAARLMDQFATGATTANLEAIARRIAPYGWHIEINIARASDWVELEPRLRRCPVPLVFDHMGRARRRRREFARFRRDPPSAYRARRLLDQDFELVPPVRCRSARLRRHETLRADAAGGPPRPLRLGHQLAASGPDRFHA